VTINPTITGRKSMAIKKLAKKISVVIFVWMAILGRKKI
jgi:hypothetical protein